LAAKPVTNIFNGTVVNQFNQPVVRASIQIPDLNIATQTDNKGKFSFKAPDSALSVSIASAGFETQHLKLQNGAVFSNQIILKPATSGGDEEVVAGYDLQKRKPAVTSKALTIDILAAEPTVNWDEYNRYLQKNKKVPGDAKDIHGDVMVTFIVDNKGALKNFSVAKSLQDQLDREAIRLIKEGPSWRLLRSKKAKVTVVVKF
jgi:TonB family protein